MITKTNLKRMTMVSLLAGVLANVGCKKDDESLNDLTGITAFGFKEDIVKNYPFTVDNVNFKIENKDSLPYGFDAGSLTAEYQIIAGSTVEINGIEQVSGTTKNDFSSPVIYKLTAEDRVSTKNYMVQVNVAQLNPEAVQWNQTSPNAFDASYVTQEHYMIGNKHFVIVGKKGATESKLYSSEDGVSWTEVGITGDFPLGFNHNIVSDGETAWVLGYLEMTDPYGLGDPQYYQSTLGENAYYTTDGEMWTKAEGALVEGEGWGTIYKGRINVPAMVLDGTLYSIGGNTAVFGNFNGGKPVGALFYPPAGLSSTTLLSADGITYTESAEYTAEMPRRAFSASFVYDGKMYIAGGLGTDATSYSDVWSSADGVNWSLVSDGQFSARHKASTVVYDNKIWMIGGLLADGTCTSEILVSEDGGETWSPVIEEKALPANFTARCNADVSVDEDGNLWIVGGEYTDLSTDQDGNVTVNYHTLTDVWTGKLNKL